jgi:hypothetical protein
MVKRKHHIPEVEEMLNSLTDEEIETGIIKNRGSLPVDDTPGTTRSSRSLWVRPLKKPVKTKTSHSRKWGSVSVSREHE